MRKIDIQSKEFAEELTKMLGELEEGIEKLKSESEDTLTDMMVKLRSQDNLPSDNPGYIGFHNFVTGAMCMVILFVLREKNKST